MAIRSILFDLDDTLVVEEVSADAAFLATCEQAHEKYGIGSEALHQSVRYHAGELWRASATITYCRSIGISSWEGLWARFLGDDPTLEKLHAWAPTYRREAWDRALTDHGVNNLAFAERLSDVFASERRERHVVFSDVEDSLTRDILGAQRAGLKAVWLNRSGNDATSQVTPDIQIENLSQIHELLPTLTD